MSTQKVKLDPGALGRQDTRQRRWTVGTKVGAVAEVAAIGLVALVLFAGLISSDRAKMPAGTGPTISHAPEVDYVIDLNTGEMTPLPKAIIRSLGGEFFAAQYAVSPDGSQLASGNNPTSGPGYRGREVQIFIAAIDGTGIRQVTHDPKGASSPAWSPDGTRIAYEGHSGRYVRSLFVVDVASGESTQIENSGVTQENPRRDVLPLEPQFTPDGSSLVYTDGSDSHSVIRTVPVAGGKSTLLIGSRGNLGDADNGSLSPDGSLVTFLGSEIGQPGPQRWVANADGTELRLLPDVYGIPCESNPAGTWSPDGSRIVCSEASRIIVVDIATGRASPVAQGRGGIWLDDHTLLVSV
jgi:Tol biopolymer transport system component